MRYRCNSPLIRLFALSTMVAATAFATTPKSTDFLKDWILDGEFAYGMAKPEAVATGDAREILWAGDGSVLFTIRDDRTQDSHLLDPSANGPLIVSSWIRKSGRTRDVMRITSAPEEFSLESIPGCPLVIVHTATHDSFLDETSGRLTPLAASPTDFMLVGGMLSPVGKRISLIYRRMFMSAPQASPAGSVPVPAPTTERLFTRVTDFRGIAIAEASIPPSLAWKAWSTDGWPVFYTIGRRDIKTAKSFALTPQGLNAYQGDVLEDKTPDTAYLRTSMYTLTSQKTQTSIRSGWLDAVAESDRMHALICADIDNRPQMSPAQDAVAYIEHGVPTVRRILKMSKAAFLGEVADAEKAAAMSAAKQNATAIMIYAADADDALPLSGSYADSIEPYMKNQALSRQFTYTFGGGPFGKDNDPSKTEIGYVATAGGRAVAYGDGHVVWLPNP